MKKNIYFYDFDRHEGAFCVHITVREETKVYYMKKKCSLNSSQKKIHRKREALDFRLSH